MDEASDNNGPADPWLYTTTCHDTSVLWSVDIDVIPEVDSVRQQRTIEPYGDSSRIQLAKPSNRGYKLEISKRRKELFESVRECLENERRSPRYRSNPGNDSSLWFETSVRSNVFRSHFRMGRPTFNYIVDISQIGRMDNVHVVARKTPAVIITNSQPNQSIMGLIIINTYRNVSTTTEKIPKQEKNIVSSLQNKVLTTVASSPDLSS
ncbi:hypothetical protein BLOT_011185 [Blomia tropicalis]|nr:hypothetical protein BLOT_011185 [Blomia tropicalis]